MTVPANTPVAPQASLWEDFIDIFTSPSAVFRRRENSGFGMQLLIVTVLFAIIILGTKSLMQPVFDAEMARQTAQVLKAHPEITADKIQGADGDGREDRADLHHRRDPDLDHADRSGALGGGKDLRIEADGADGDHGRDVCIRARGYWEWWRAR